MIDSKARDNILSALPDFREKLRDLREIVLANAVMIGEIPAPTFEETSRTRFILDRFTESGLHTISSDEAGNCTAIIPGTDGKDNILISSHVDTEFSSATDHTMNITPDTILGSGIADNSFGVAVMASLPAILEKLNIKLKHNLVLLGAVKSLGKGNLEGLRFFVNNTPLKFKSAICLEGVHLGRLSYSCHGMMRAEIICSINKDKTPDQSAAIIALNRIITRMMEIRLPQEPKTSIILGAINGGKTFGKPASKARLRFEVRSEQTGMVGEILKTIQTITEEIDSEELVDVELNIVSRNKAGGIPFVHPLVQNTRSIMKELGIKPRLAPSVGDLSAIISKNIPALTLGLTTGSKKEDDFEYINIDPIFSGIAQLLGVIISIDQGVCDDED